MKKIVRNSAVIFTLLCSLLPAGAQKRGIFDKNSFRPEKVTVEAASTSARPRQADAVFPIGVRSLNRIADVTDRAAATGLSTRMQAPARVLGDGTRIYGSLIYSNTWVGSSASYGIYSFPASSYTIPELVYAQGGYEANGGGCYYNGKYYWNSYVYTDEMGYTFTTFCTYDFKTGELTKNIQSFINDTFDLQQITNALAYDPSSNRMFALANVKVVDETGVIAKYYPALSEVDPFTGFVTPIAQIPTMVALASSASGELYAISKGDNASLYRLNKNTGDITLIGATGLSTNFAQSMTFDPITGKLYWAAVKSNGTTALYEVDTTTGKASEIFPFGNNEEFTGLYIPEPEVAAGAPGAVTEIATSFPAGSLSGSISVTAPSLSYSGTPLSGTIELTILTDDGAAEVKSVAPGATVTVERTLTEGIHSFRAYASNSEGEGPRMSRSCYVGIDAPAQVRNLTLAHTADGKAEITWDAPLTGRNDGYIDPAQITYTIRRYPDETVVAENLKATSFIDPVEEQANNYWFEVIPFCGNREGKGAITESGIFGYGTSLPCLFSLDTKEEFDLFTVIDANGDWDGEYKWGGWMFGGDFKYTTEEDGNCAVYGYHPETAADDWLITPPVGVEKGKKYRLTFTMWTRGQAETIEVTAGPRNTIASQSVILPKADYTHKDHREFVVDFPASESGNYYIGFHITSKKKQYYAFISDIKVDIVPDEDAPSAISNLKVTPSATGASEATLTFNAPTTTLGGTALTSLDKIEIFHGTETAPLTTLTATPGESLSWTDTGIDGWVDYRVVPYAKGKAGEKAEARVYVGWDIPEAAGNVTVSDETGHPVVSWTAPETGINGGYIDSSKLTYAVYRYEDEFVLLDRAVKGTTYTDIELDAEPQHLVAYVVVPQSPAGFGDASASSYIVYGNPYAGEFLETFEDATVHSTPWTMYRLRGNTQNWGLTSYGSNPICSPVDNDYGMAVYTTDGWSGDEGLLVSPKLDISGINTPVLTFYFYHNYTDEHAAWDEAFEDRFIPEVMLPDGERIALHEPIYVDDLGTGWLKYTCDLSTFKNYPYIQLALHGITACEQEIYIDRLSVTNLIANDLQAYAFTGSTKVEAGKGATYKLTVYNRGASRAEAGSYRINLYDEESLIDSRNGVAIESKGYLTYIFEREYGIQTAGSTHHIWAEIAWDDDEIQGNNLSDVVTTEVKSPVLPEVSDLAASTNEKSVTLTWGYPNSRHVKDSFEEHTPYEIEDFGGYTLIDGDGNYTWSFSDIYFDNAGEAQSFMVFNPVALGIVDRASSLFPYDAFDPHNGNQVLACFQGLTVNSEGYGVSATNDDWFISPEVFGGQTIVLYAKSGDYMQGFDKFEVMYSTSGTNTAAFKELSEVLSTTAEWTRHEFTLPANAKYFAIHCVSEDGFILFIDDLEFVERRNLDNFEHTGYRLYRDGKLVSEFSAGTKSFADNIPAEGRYIYHITALYADGRESLPSNYVEVSIGELGVKNPADNTEIRVENGMIEISCDDYIEASVVSIDGQVIYRGEGTCHKVKVAPGVYIVKAGARTCRIIV